VIDVTTLVGAEKELRRHGIGHALAAARRVRHDNANEAALATADAQNALQIHPVGTLNPVQYLDWRTELERVRSAGVAALRFFPGEQGWTVLSEAFRTIARAARMPLLVPVDRFGDATAIGAATAPQGTPTVLLGAHYTNLGDCLAALERWPDLYLETSRLAQFRGVETVVRSVGANRLLFGSGAPQRPIQAALNAVLTADVTEEEKRAILAGNARRLFGLPSTDFDLPEPTRAEHLIDVHGHVGALGLPVAHGIAGGPGIDLTIASSLRAIAEDTTRGNQEAFAAISAMQQAYVVVDPNDCAASCAAMDDAYRREVAVGAKLHCSYSHTATASPECVALLREVARRGRPLKIHVDGPDWDDPLACVAHEYPAWKLIVAHAGPGTPSTQAAALVEQTSNVYVELSTSFPELDIIRDVVCRVGPERLLFGSDAPLLDPAYALGTYADAGANLARTTVVAKELFGL